GKHRRAGVGAAKLYAVGRGEARVEAGGRRWRLGAGELAFLPRADEHVVSGAAGTVVPRDGSACVGMHQVGASTWASSEGADTGLVVVDLDLDARDAPWVSLLGPVVHVTEREGPLGRWLRETLALLTREELSSPLQQAIAGPWAQSLFALALRADGATLPGAAALRDEPVVAALAQVRARPEHAWELRELAARVGLSRSVLAARTSALLGEPLGAYVRRLRHRRATELLATTEAPIKEIAARVGYGSEPAFHRAFARLEGATPLAYRRSRRLRG
ncbi:MAG: AraC family transcriptional regulator, partial [Myxococcales bacterium]